MKVAIVCDALASPGGLAGGERVVLTFHELFPEAPIYTTVYNPEVIPEFSQLPVKTSFIQKLPFARTRYKFYLLLMPTAVEHLDLRDYDLVISSSSSMAKGVLTRPDTLHVCYCLTPMRWAWNHYHQYLRQERLGPFGRAMWPFVAHYLRLWDSSSAQRVTHFIAISRAVAKRIHAYYGRKAAVIHPPVDTELFRTMPPEKIEDFYLIVSRMVAYKRIDIAVEAFNRLGLPLVVIGDGAERKRLQKMSKPNITFLGRQQDAVIADYYARCKAFIFTSEEDFGITPLEAQASGRPVIAYQRGGALETVVEGVTGEFVNPQTAEALAQSVREFKEDEYHPELIRQHALEFNREQFKQRIKNFVELAYREHQQRLAGEAIEHMEEEEKIPSLSLPDL